MFYILDFSNHSFITCHTTTEVVNFIKEYRKADKDDMDIEIINAYPEDIRLTIDEFMAQWEVT